MSWRDCITARLKPVPDSSRVRDHPLEALRGVCALLVFVAHGFIAGPATDPVYAPPANFWWLNLGLPAVLMFFVLSGYVIGLTTREPFGQRTATRYLSRRALRLLPVTYAAIALAWLFHPATQLHTILGNAFFLQNTDPYPGVHWHFPLLENNGALWTLNYEMLYYLLFIVLWWKTPPAAAVFGFVLSIPIARALGFPVSVVIGRYACGACYWLAGLSVAWLTVPTLTASPRSHWPSALLGAYAIWHLGEVQTFIYDTRLYSLLDSSVVSLHRLDFIPVCLWCLLAVTGRAIGLEKKLAVGCLLWGWIGFARSLFLENVEGLLGVTGGALLVASVLMRWKYSVSPLKCLAPLGGISFGVYALASPIQIAQKRLFPEFSGTPFTFSVRLTLLLIFIIGVAWIVDYRFNRWVSARLRK